MEVLVTYTALLIQFNSFEKDVARFEAMAGAMFRAVNLDVATKQPPQGFVDLLYSIAAHLRPVKHATGEVKHTNKSADRILRAYACAAPTSHRPSPRVAEASACTNWRCGAPACSSRCWAATGACRSSGRRA